MHEAEITISGQKLTQAQSSTLRVAIGHFLMDMAVVDILGSDEHGENLRRAYQARASEIQDLIFKAFS